MVRKGVKWYIDKKTQDKELAVGGGKHKAGGDIGPKRAPKASEALSEESISKGDFHDIYTHFNQQAEESADPQLGASQIEAAMRDAEETYRMIMDFHRELSREYETIMRTKKA